MHLHLGFLPELDLLFCRGPDAKDHDPAAQMTKRIRSGLIRFGPQPSPNRSWEPPGSCVGQMQGGWLPQDEEEKGRESSRSRGECREENEQRRTEKMGDGGSETRKATSRVPRVVRAGQRPQPASCKSRILCPLPRNLIFHLEPLSACCPQD